MACDSLYAAWLKVYYPYELYITMLKLYDEKKNTEKISAIISEMKRYQNISLTIGQFGQDNRDWLVDREHSTISQSLSSVKHISKKAAQDLYRAGQMKFDSFTDLLRELQMNTCLDTRQIKILIELNYFSKFGKSLKLMKVFEEFFEGKQKLTKTVKSFDARLSACRCREKSLEDETIPIQERLNSELSNIGLCLSTDTKVSSNLYFVKEIDTKYGAKAVLYSVKRGTTGTVRFRKNDFIKNSFEIGDCVRLIKFNKSPRYTYRSGERAVIPDQFDIWAQQYETVKAPNRN